MDEQYELLSTKFKNHQQGAPRFELGTSRSAVECSTTELHPHMNFLSNFKFEGKLLERVIDVAK